MSSRVTITGMNFVMRLAQVGTETDEPVRRSMAFLNWFTPNFFQSLSSRNSFISSNLPEYRIDDLQVASLLSIRIAVDPLITTVSQISFEGSSAYRGERITVSNFGLA